MGRFAGFRQGLAQRLPVNKQVQAQNSFVKDENTTVKLVNNQLPESRTKLQKLGNLGRTGIQVVLRRRDSAQQQQQQQQQKQQQQQQDASAPNPQATLIALHDACSNKSEASVIQYLVARHPDGAQAKNKQGNLPLHTACARKAPLATIEYLLEAFSEGTGERNKRYKLPIHVALECGASLDVIKALVKADPDSLQVADYDIASVQFQKVWIAHKVSGLTMNGRAGLPLHTACKFVNSLQTIHFLITEYPDAARTKNKDGWLPVHFTCARGAPLQHVQYLMTACPSSLYERTNHYYEYPMHLASGRMNANLKVVQYIQSRHTIACTQTKPNEGLYLTYHDEAIMQAAPPLITCFLSRVCARAKMGYGFISTVEDPYN